MKKLIEIEIQTSDSDSGYSESEESKSCASKSKTDTFLKCSPLQDHHQWHYVTLKVRKARRVTTKCHLEKGGKFKTKVAPATNQFTITYIIRPQ